MTRKNLIIGDRPSDAERWIHRSDPRTTATAKASLYTARLTVDVTPALRARIKLAAIAGQVTAAELLRTLLEREFPAERAP